MADVSLFLGPIVLQDFEVPSGINFGGRQRVAVHRLPGGLRVIDALGRDDAQISFAGIFTGTDATLRARGVDELRVAGIALPLSWDVFFYTVLITDFRADYRSGTWIPYCIVCTVLQDEAQALLQTTASLATVALSDVADASSYAAAAGLDLSALQTSLTASGAITRGTAAYTSARNGLVDSRSAIHSSISDADATLSGINIEVVGNASAGVAALDAATDASGRLSSLYTARAYVQRAAGNLANAST